ncbi:MAG: AIDA repeat-containing protein, partial [Lentisphaeria bacterium]|nr:AIDA repeat-containing protein [Lentisphaeria bacterium]
MAYYVSNGQVSTGINLSSASMFVFSGGTANSTTVNPWGELRVSSGGSMNNTTVNSGGEMYVSNGATANNTTVNYYGTLEVLSGGLASNIKVNSGGELFVRSGGKITGNLDTFPMTLYVEDGSIIDFDISESIAPSGPVRSDLWYINSDGVPNLTITITVSANQNGGVYDYYSAGNFDYLLSGNSLSFSIGTAEERFGSLTVNGDSRTYGNCTYKLTYDKNHGHFRLTVTNGTPEYPYVISGAVLTVRNEVSAGYRYVDTTVNSGGEMYVSSGGMASRTTVNSGGYLHVSSGGNVTGTLEISSGGYVYFEEGGEMNFDLTARQPSDAVLINDARMIGGWLPSFTITVSSSQAGGTYKLAGGLAGFTEYLAGASATISTTDNVSSSISIGETVTLSGRDYTLDLDAGLATLTVSGGAPVVSGTAGDLNADGRADIIMTIDQSGHPSDGSTGAWLIQENQTAAWGDLSTRNAGFVIFGTGKTAAGKNTDDVYIRNSDNLIGAWTTNNDGMVSGWETVGEFDAETQIVGLGDFNGNGQTDLLLR